MTSVQPVRRGQVLLLAAVAEAVLGEADTASRRVDAIFDLDHQAVVLLARTAARYITSAFLARGADWTTNPDDDANIEDRVDRPRVFTLRLLAAESAKDTDTVDALLTAVPHEVDGRTVMLRDLFEYALDWAGRRSQEVTNPPVMVGLMDKAIKETDPGLDWGPPL